MCIGILFAISESITVLLVLQGQGYRPPVGYKCKSKAHSEDIIDAFGETVYPVSTLARTCELRPLVGRKQLE